MILPTGQEKGNYSDKSACSTTGLSPPTLVIDPKLNDSTVSQTLPQPVTLPGETVLAVPQAVSLALRQGSTEPLKQGLCIPTGRQAVW